MAYHSITEMTASQSLSNRIAAAAAEAGYPNDPRYWVQNNIWLVVSQDPEWVARWDDANFNYNLTFNPDTGERPDVITDQLIQDVVGPMIEAIESPAEPPT